VQHQIDATVHHDPRRDVLLEQREARLAREVSDVARVAGEEAVHAHDGMPVGEEALAQV
jgi:hypothetical protein